jgi:hypothetical protein
MAFDQTTRNRLHRFVSQSRAILMEEFTRQLQAVYGMDPANGTVADVDTLSFLDNEGQQAAVILRETLAHYVAAIPGKSEKEKIRQGLDRIIREQSFTVLNRLAALRMAEARGFLIESIARGTSSKGFQLYKNLAGTALGETGDAFRCFLFSLFDEFSLDLAVLFDRHSVQGRLFPREAALLALLEQINHFEIEPLWAEDETIGWIYQYFNSQEERKQMRKASQAPRNSRELAVRNQFFTPRYVVEFLTDNTLGRIWYDMTRGHTALKDICRYLVRRPNEIFLAAGEIAPETAEENLENLSREELLKQPVYVPFRRLKDPRELRMLDPACGSMHFGLYAFDLFETIYEEAWRIETDMGPDMFDRSTHLKPLQETFTGVDEFKKAIPQLIIEQNIHGVDIDPRAVQIAGLSLWQRAQRSWHQMGIKPGHRPAIRKSNIVCAEPMPGEKELLREFTAGLNPPVLGQLVETIFDKMQLAGEAGTLLKIEQEITSAISDAKEAYNNELLKQKEAAGYLPGMAPKREPSLFDFAELHHDGDFWETAEEKILTALKNYAAQAESHEGQKRLFAEDAAKGFAFIDLCRKRFDVVLMNPPFGSPTKRTDIYLKTSYSDYGHDVINNFIERAIHIGCSKRFCGVILSRTIILNERISNFRVNCLLGQNSLSFLVDLGNGVLDAAVDTAAMVFKDHNINENTLCADILRVIPEEKGNAVVNFVSLNHDKTFLVKSKDFELVPMGVLCYWIQPWILELFKMEKLDPKIGVVKKGLITGDDERFARNCWEVNDDGWHPFFKGGDFSTFYSPLDMRINWATNGNELRAFAIGKYGSESRTLKNIQYIGKKSLGWGIKNSIGFGVRLIEDENVVYNDNGPAFFPEQSLFSSMEIYGLLSIFNSSLFKLLLRVFQVGERGRYQWLSAHVTLLPIPTRGSQRLNEIGKLITDKFRSLYSYFEEHQTFNFEDFITFVTNFHPNTEEGKDFVRYHINHLSELYTELDDIVLSCYCVDADAFYSLGSDILDNRERPENNYKRIYDQLCGNLDFRILSIKFGTQFERWSNFNAAGIFSSEDLNSFLTLTDEISFREIFFQIKDQENYFNKPLGFFDEHLKIYSCNKRPSPIYWPLQTLSGSYTLWVYYHRLTDQTLYTCVNDFVEPKLKTVSDDLTALRNQTTRSSAEEKELAALSDLENELKDFRDELLRIAGFWKPDLNDGVQITAAPLWKLFQHRQWQNKLKDTWKKMEAGEYDWAHLACSIWPERVLRKCHSDRSLAIAHDVETDFWEEIEVPVIRRGKDTGKTKLEWHPKPLTEDRLQELIHQKMAAMRSSH